MCERERRGGDMKKFLGNIIPKPNIILKQEKSDCDKSGTNVLYYIAQLRSNAKNLTL